MHNQDVTVLDMECQIVGPGSRTDAPQSVICNEPNKIFNYNIVTRPLKARTDVRC
jgi:hypothetical protein